MRAVPQVPFTQLHELEILNAFEFLTGRSLITRDESHAIRAQLQEYSGESSACAGFIESGSGVEGRRRTLKQYTANFSRGA